MSGFRMTFSGLNELQRGLIERSHLEEAKMAVKKNGAELQTGIQRKANFKGHYEYRAGRGKVFVKPSGTTRRSVGLRIRNSGLTAVSGPTTEYSGYLEHGTRFMNAQPFVRPAFNVQKPKFVADLRKLVK